MGRHNNYGKLFGSFVCFKAFTEIQAIAIWQHIVYKVYIGE
ncbi:hypothetical protein GRFL_0869 [Christiangramia flava JLT2011]|uniref:Uncharacterized protein n=1 Tax=Christiangramia flava JLT2011 TaxID=1229726 RepID=A0A1L7I331_9FLAO|nr:hypothetical protein GRFL_0869 [Christiangramia flava JLT2011]